MLIGRERELQNLKSFLGKWTKGVPLVPTIFVYGQAGTGKTLTIQHAVSSLSDFLITASVNCVEAYSSRVLFAEILHQIDSHSLGMRQSSSKEENDKYAAEEDDIGEEKTTTLYGITTAASCRFSVNDFVNQLRQRVTALPDGHSVCLFFDQAERLRDIQPHLVDVLTRLYELCESRVVSIFASRIAWEKFPCGAFAGVEPMVLHFPNYSREELFELLVEITSAETSQMVSQLELGTEAAERQIYIQFVNLLLDVLSPVCRDAGELSFLALSNFSKYIAPLHDAEKTLSSSDEIGLWRRFEPHLRLVMQNVFLRHSPSNDPGEGGDSGGKLHLELPFFTRFLLLAAYMASYNPKSADKKFLVKNTALAGRMTSRAKHSAKRSERTKNHLLGPKPFPLDRWMAIFYTIIEDRIPHSVGIVAQVPTLVSLNLVSQVSGEDCLSKPKYKCLIPLDIARAVAKSVDFDLLSFLLDFS